MADYSGVTSGNITINDGDTIGATAILTVSAGDTATVTAGATVQVYNARSIYIEGTWNSTGTEANPIILESQNADPTSSAWSTFRPNYASTADTTMKWTKVKNCTYFMYFHDFPDTAIDLSQCWVENCNSGFVNVNTYPCEGASWVFEDIFFDRTPSCVSWYPDSTQTVEFRRFWSQDPQGGSLRTHPSNGLTFDYIVYLNGGGGCFNFVTGVVENVTATRLYINEYSYNCYVGGTSTADISESIFYAGAYNGMMYVTGGQADSSYNDFVNGGGLGARCTAGTLNSDYDYFAGNVDRPSDVVDVSTGTQYSGLTSHTNAQSTPNQPLIADNVSEGTPTAEAITITYDCATGTSGKRAIGLPFIKYGTTTGVYTEQSYLPPKEEWGLYWISWKTDMSWSQTGHSVSLENLKAGTKYYYQCCFIDPFGRVGVSSEGDFTTASAGGGAVIGLVG